MKTLCWLAAAVGLLIAAPAVAQEPSYGSGAGYVSLWSGAQGTAFTYGNADAYGTSSSGAESFSGGRVTSGTGVTNGGGMSSAITTSTAGATSYGGGYAQTQTSGYAGGRVH